MEQENIEHIVRSNVLVENEVGKEIMKDYPFRSDVTDVVDDLTVLEKKDIKFGDENTESENYNMIVTEEDQEEICVGTDRYNMIQNEEVLQPIIDCIDNMNINIVGQIRDYKSSLSMDIFPVNKQDAFKNLNSVNGNFAIGLEYRLSHDKTSSIKVRPIVVNYNNTKSTHMRVGSWRKVRHYKPEDKESKNIYNSVYTMTSEVMFEMGYLAERFVEKIENSYSTLIDMGENETSLGEVYRAWLPEDTPEKVIQGSVTSAMDRESDSRVQKNVYSMWSIVSGFTNALTNVSSMKDGNNKDRYYKKAKLALEFPERARNDVLEEIEDDDLDEEQLELSDIAQTEKELRDIKS